MQFTSLFVQAALLTAATVNAVCYNCYMTSNSYPLASTTCNGLEEFDLNGTHGWLYKGCDATCPGENIYWTSQC